jgi:hypothetical protein
MSPLFDQSESRSECLLYTVAAERPHSSAITVAVSARKESDASQSARHTGSD